MALDTDPADLIARAREYPLNHSARMALLTEAIAVGVCNLVARAGFAPHVVPEAVPPLSGTPPELVLADEPGPVPPTPARARRPRAKAPTDTNAS